ncbi:unnamed protein product [Gadus morhua 'NCC']
MLLNIDSPAKAALCWGCALSHTDGKDSMTQLLTLPGRPVTMPCAYRYEDHGEVPQLSVQWRGPPGRGLLCHYIKHKAFQNCTPGYSLSYRPASILLTIQQVQAWDYGTHVCSVSKRHDVSDNSVHLAMRTEGVNEGQSSGRPLPGPTQGLAFLPALWWIMCT